MVKTMAKLRMAHASTHGARKPPGPKFLSGDNTYIQPGNSVSGLIPVFVITHANEWIPFYTHKLTGR